MTKLEPANIVCPKCGSPSYMRHLIGKNVGHLDLKCINCNSYFNFDELYDQAIAKVIKPKMTNADRLNAMTVEEKAEWFEENATGCPPGLECYGPSANPSRQDCIKCWLNWLNKTASDTYWLDWLKQEVTE